MKIGLTYDLRDEYLLEGFTQEETAELDSEETIHAIQHTLQELGYHTARIGNVQPLVDKLSKGESWDFVFNTSEGMFGLSREAQIPALLEAYQIPYTFSDPLILSITLHKGIAKQLIRALNIPTPDFCVVQSIDDINQVTLDYPLFAKPIAEGTSKGISELSIIQNEEQLRNIVVSLLKTFNQPVLIETYLPGDEFTVGIVGTGKGAKVIGVCEVIHPHQAKILSYKVKESDSETLQKARPVIADQCQNLALKAWRELGCRDAGRVDLRMDENGLIHFLEINPLAGLNPHFSHLALIAKQHNIHYRSLISMIVKATLTRL